MNCQSLNTHFTSWILKQIIQPFRDLTGCRELETLTNEVLSIGNYSINWNASDYPSGVYLIRMESGDFTQTQKVVLVK
jgi:hypothetical protein